jgi:hypothetical protein
MAIFYNIYFRLPENLQHEDEDSGLCTTNSCNSEEINASLSSSDSTRKDKFR